MGIYSNINDNIKYLNKILPIDKSFDIMTRKLIFGKTRAYWIGINGFCKSDSLQWLFSDLQNITYTEDSIIENIELYMNSKIGYIQTSLCDDWNLIIKNILSGPSVLFIDGFSKCIILDTRTFPLRSIEEPDTEKVTRGARDGFIESIISNTSLIRRRLRDPDLTFEITSVGSKSQTDIAIAYINGVASEEVINEVKNRLKSMNLSTLTMGTKSLEEVLVKKHWYNFLPSIFSTERPDVACSYIAEGHVAIVVDTSPSVLILPCTIFQFTQSPEDYYKSIGVGNYIRFIRFLCIFISLLSLPIFMLFSNMPPIKLFVYILLIELGLDLFKYSSAHAPSGFSGSLSLIGGLILSEAAIELNWTSSEVIFYGAATMLATLSLSNLEFAEAIRLYRLFLVICTGFLGLWGFLTGCIFIVVSIITTPTFAGRSYFWPLFPLNKTALWKLLFRYPTSKAQPIKSNRKS